MARATEEGDKDMVAIHTPAVGQLGNEVCAQCDEPIYKRADGVWDLVYREWSPSEYCLLFESGQPIGFTTAGHTPLEPAEDQ